MAYLPNRSTTPWHCPHCKRYLSGITVNRYCTPPNLHEFFNDYRCPLCCRSLASNTQTMYYDKIVKDLTSTNLGLSVPKLGA